mmetsp:Transcript_111032/g.310240  ORF Transcript_111032/g.310240 Transcript_111032/m.310240 type:complete len:213 (-) Transcript_111032:127-765(-)
MAFLHAKGQVLVEAPLDEHVFRRHVQHPQVRRYEEDAIALRSLRQHRTSEDSQERALPHSALADEADELPLVDRDGLVEHARRAHLRPHVALAGAQSAQADADAPHLDRDAVLDRLPRRGVQVDVSLHLLELRAGDVVLVSAPLHPVPQVRGLVDDVNDALQRGRVVEGLQELAVHVAPELADLHVDTEAGEVDARRQGAVDDIEPADHNVR